MGLNFLRTVDRERFEVHPVVIIRPWESAPFFVNELERLGYGDTITRVPLRTGGGMLSVLGVAWRLHSVLRRGTFDVIHTQGYFANICGLVSARLLRVKCMTTCHGFVSSDKKLQLYNFIDRYAIRLCHTIISVSEEMKLDLAATGLPAERITVVPNAVDTGYDVQRKGMLRTELRGQMQITESTYVIGYIGRLSDEKGLVHLLDAFSHLISAEIDAMLMIVGDGPKRRALEQLVKRRGLENKVQFAGFQSDTRTWLAAFDCFVLPSLTEGTPMALLEAMSQGIPVIATSVGGVPKVVKNGINGFLVSPGNSSAINEKIQVLLRSPHLAIQFSDAGLRTISEDYCLDKWCRIMEERYIELAKGRKY